MLRNKDQIERELAVDERESKLPRWVQDKLISMRRIAREAVDANEQARLASDPDGSNTLLDCYEETPIGLGKGTEVRFLVGENSLDYIDVKVRQDPNGPYLHVAGGDSLLVFPQATNVVSVRMGRL